jgi:hypothetical protein
MRGLQKIQNKTKKIILKTDIWNKEESTSWERGV